MTLMVVLGGDMMMDEVGFSASGFPRWRDGGIG